MMKVIERNNNNFHSYRNFPPLPNLFFFYFFILLALLCVSSVNFQTPFFIFYLSSNVLFIFNIYSRKKFLECILMQLECTPSNITQSSSSSLLLLLNIILCLLQKKVYSPHFLFPPLNFFLACAHYQRKIFNHIFSMRKF